MFFFKERGNLLPSLKAIFYWKCSENLRSSETFNEFLYESLYYSLSWSCLSIFSSTQNYVHAFFRNTFLQFSSFYRSLFVIVFNKNVLSFLTG